MALNPVNALSVSSAIVAFLKLGATLLERGYMIHNRLKGGDPLDLEHEKLTPILFALSDRLKGCPRVSVGCLTKDEKALEDLGINSSRVADDLTERVERVRAAAALAPELFDRQETVKKVWIMQDLDTLALRLSTFRLEFETKVIPFLKNTIDIPKLSEPNEFDAFDPNVKDMIEMLLGNLVMFQESQEVQNLRNKEIKDSNHEQDPAIMLQGIQIADKSEISKSAVASWNQEEAVFSDKQNLLQDFILEKLSFSSMRDREEEVVEAHGKTFEWIYAEEGPAKVGSNFCKWLENDNEGIYWINGKAGSGKSTLMRFINDHKKTAKQLQVWARERPLTMAGFFFWISGSYEQRSQAGLLRYLLYQLLQQHRSLIPVTFPDLWSKFWAASTQERVTASVSWSLQSLISGLQTFLKQSTGKTKICLFVDGLDEFDGDHDEIVQLFKTIVDSSNNDMKICVSSRPWPVFQEAFNDIPGLKLQDLTLSDMNQYVDDKFNKDPRIRSIVRKEPSNGHSLMSEIVRRADGVFLWIIIVIRALLEELRPNDTVADIQSRLHTLPTELDGLFQHTLFDTQSEDYVKEASRIFQLIRAREIVCDFTRDQSAASLTLWELILAYDDQDDDLSLKLPIYQISSQDASSRCQEMINRLQSRSAGLLKLYSKNHGNAGRTRFGEEDSVQKIHILAQSKIIYLHRTVRDFLIYSGVWDYIVSKTTFSTFDAHLSLLKSYVKILQQPFQQPEQHRRLDEWWPDIVTALTHARHITPPPTHPINHPSTTAITQLNNLLSWYWLPRRPRFSSSTTTTNPDDDTWARSAFGTYETRGKTPHPHAFLSLCAKFGLDSYLAAQLSSSSSPPSSSPTITHADTTAPPLPHTPLLTHALEHLLSRRHTIYPLSTSSMIRTLLSHGADPNQRYIPMGSRTDSTPWLRALECVREGQRRGWIEYYDVAPEGTQRWVEILRLLVVEGGADLEAEIRENKWDPRASAWSVVEGVWGVYGNREVRGLRELLAERGAGESGGGEKELDSDEEGQNEQCEEVA